MKIIIFITFMVLSLGTQAKDVGIIDSSKAKATRMKNRVAVTKEPKVVAPKVEECSGIKNYSLGYSNFDMNSVEGIKGKASAIRIGAELQCSPNYYFTPLFAIKGTFDISKTSNQTLLLPSLSFKAGLPLYLGANTKITSSVFAGMSYIKLNNKVISNSQVVEVNGLTFQYGLDLDVAYSLNKDLSVGVKLEYQKLHLSFESNWVGIAPSLSLNYSF